MSTIVGAMDLPSRTPWRVEIRLPPDRAAFETRVLWHNPTPLEQPYYNWMTAAAFAQDDLELFVPGTAYLEHSGRVRPWPVDEDGRFLPLYRNNAFGGSKSYHVVGALNDFFGGYYHDDGYGWGHWARHEEMPGRKMWLWALSREGGIWEDLLTDTDGQYVEFQAGRLHVQYQPGAHRNPISQAGFDPLSASRWTEVWFPLEGTGGLTDASPRGAMHVEGEDGRLRVVVQAFGAAADTVKAWSGGERIATRAVTLEPLEPVVIEFDVAPDGPWRVSLPGLGLESCSNPGEPGLGGICGLDGDRVLSRPFATNAGAWDELPETDRLVFEARELARGRLYPEARALYERVADAEPWNREALLGLGALALRSARYEEGLAHARRALQLDTYDPEANFLAGNLYRALGRRADALDSFGWAAGRWPSEPPRASGWRSWPSMAGISRRRAATPGWRSTTTGAAFRRARCRRSRPVWRGMKPARRGCSGNCWSWTRSTISRGPSGTSRRAPGNPGTSRPPRPAWPRRCGASIRGRRCWSSP